MWAHALNAVRFRYYSCLAYPTTLLRHQPAAEQTSSRRRRTDLDPRVTQGLARDDDGASPVATYNPCQYVDLYLIPSALPTLNGLLSAPIQSHIHLHVAHHPEQPRSVGRLRALQ